MYSSMYEGLNPLPLIKPAVAKRKLAFYTTTCRGSKIKLPVEKKGVRGFGKKSPGKKKYPRGVRVGTT